MMITTFDDFCLWMYVMVDDAWKEMAPQFQRPGPEPSSCSDSELLTMALVGECQGWDRETELLGHWKKHPDLFPHQPSQSRFNRRRRQLQQALNLLRARLLRQLDLAQDRQCVMDSLPVEVVAFHHAPRASSQWRAAGATYGRVTAKHMTFFGYKLHLLTTLSGVILDWVLVAAHIRDLPVAEDLLDHHADLTVLGDKAYISAPVAADLWQRRRIRLLTLPKRNHRRQLPTAWHKPFEDARRIIETLNSQLTEQFRLERNHAHSLFGLSARLATKLTAHVLCVYLNRLLGAVDCLHIKHLAFPI